MPILHLAVRVAAAAAVSMAALGAPAALATPHPFVRHADVGQDRLVFGYAGDLWVSARDGSGARRLTTGLGEKRNPRLSPDGRAVAYTLAEEGRRGDVYVIGVEGGPARRVTYHPADELVLDWTADGAKLLIATDAASGRNRFRQLYLVDAKGGLPVRLPPPYGETAALSADGASLVFTTSPDFQEEAWKRYRGGRAPDLWRMDLRTRQAERIAPDDAPDSTPMLHGEAVYFLSERGPEKRSNIHVWRPGQAVRQVTRFTDADVRFPAIGGGAIAFTLGGRLHVLDLASEQATPVDPVIAQQDVRGQAERRAVGREVQGMAIAPDGQTAAFEAHGDIFTLGLADGVAANVTRTPGIAERNPAFGAGGRLLFVSDASGEYALAAADKARAPVTAVTAPGRGFINTAVVSPDSRWAAYVDDAMGLQLADLKSGQVRRVDTYRWLDPEAPDSVRAAVSWSPDGRWLAYGRELANRNSAIVLHDTATGAHRQVTSGFYSDFSPQFSADGRYLFTLSQRKLDPTQGDIDSTWTYANSVSLSAIPLTASAPRPGDTSWAPGALAKPGVTAAWDVAGAEARLVDLGPRGAFGQLSLVKDKLLYLQRQGETSSLVVFDLAARREVRRLEKVSGFVAAPSGAILFRRGEQVLRTDIEGAAELVVELKDLRSDVVLAEENRQVVREAWRIERNRFYDPGMHGLDWDGVLARHLQMAEAAITREDMTFVVRELVAELGAGHTGAYPMARSALGGQADDVGLLGVDFSAAPGGYVISRIISPGVRASEISSPLADPTLGVREGEFLLAVNGEPLTTDRSPWAPFLGLADKVVELTVNSRPTLEGARRVKVRTLRSEAMLREMDWVEQNRRYVEKASGGRIGYAYVRDTARIGQDQLQIQYKAQHHLDALVVDARFNSGGALGDRLVELLNRPPLVYFHRRYGGDYPLPEQAFAGPKAFLTNGWSYSGGDGFPLLFKAAKVGPVIGTRTAGGLIGPNGYFVLMNGIVISAPPQRVYGADGVWPNGNDGVTPDIEVLNNPGALAQGRDEQLDTAVAHLLDQLKRQAPPPTAPRVEFTPARR